MADEDLLNAATFYIAEIRSAMIPNVQLYQSGNMQSSVVIGTVGDNFIDIIIGVPYASYTNEGSKKTAGWLEKTISRASRAYASNVRDKSTDGEAFGTDKGRKEDED